MADAPAIGLVPGEGRPWQDVEDVGRQRRMRRLMPWHCREQFE